MKEAGLGIENLPFFRDGSTSHSSSNRVVVQGLCRLMAFVYALVIALGVLLMVPNLIPADTSEDAMAMKFGGVIYLVIGLIFGGAYIVGLVTKAQSWAWVYNLVLICVGLTSCLFLPICIPLMIFWLKPEVKAFYGRT